MRSEMLLHLGGERQSGIPIDNDCFTDRRQIVCREFDVEYRPANRHYAPDRSCGAVRLLHNAFQFPMNGSAPHYAEIRRLGAPEYFEFLRGNGFATQTLPFAGGLELSVKL